jgi:hypothetical protein
LLLGVSRRITTTKADPLSDDPDGGSGSHDQIAGNSAAPASCGLIVRDTGPDLRL